MLSIYIIHIIIKYCNICKICNIVLETQYHNGLHPILFHTGCNHGSVYFLIRGSRRSQLFRSAVNGVDRSPNRDLFH